ncbi:TolC family protein [Candidatus Magnetominusculus xianensis]|uniref:Outer membrane efflux protein n=1 Tax=Candidatus Magnetominusculus xianensis TaxID=1748249 RepID=A0ABR5SEI9_9BACT|nr:TolC family protein [Candidatus Magnetominusculus xianensis]KWT82959.1 outer membrane efflux protein [Candidatus Magnetominusculus xianensis]MBF0403038.1 TolC family protein [Nitrospirota bacterium]
MLKQSLKYVAVIALALLLNALPAYCENSEHSSNVITLKEAVATALRDNHRVRAGRWAAEALKKDVSIAWGSLLPKIEVEESYSNTNNPTYFFMSKLDQGRFTSADLSNLKNPAPINNYRTTVQFEMPVFSMKAYIAIDMAKTRAEGREFQQMRLEETTVLDVFKAYTAVKTAKAYKSAAEKGLEDAKEHLRIARVRLDSGTGLLSDVLQAQTAMSEVKMRIVTAEKNVSLAQRSLGLIIGADQPYDSADEKIAFTPAAPTQVYLKGALTRADIAAMEKNRENAQQSVSIAKAEYLPTLALSGNYQLNEHRYPFGDEGKSYQIGVYMKLNVFDGFRREAQLAKARLEAAEAGEHLNGIKKQAAYEVYEAMMSLDESQKRLSLTRDALSAAEEGVRLIEKRYANSLAPMVSLIDAQTALDKVRADAAAAEGQYLVSTATLEYTGGRILEFFGVDNSGRNQ